MAIAGEVDGFIDSPSPTKERERHHCGVLRTFTSSFSIIIAVGSMFFLWSEGGRK